jgi:hypothetical protein
MTARDPRRSQVETLFAGGWKDPDQIQRLMARDGSTPPHILTIRRWIDPTFADRQRRASRDHMRRKRVVARLDELTEVEMWELALEVVAQMPRRRRRRASTASLRRDPRPGPEHPEPPRSRPPASTRPSSSKAAVSS